MNTLEVPVVELSSGLVIPQYIDGQWKTGGEMSSDPSRDDQEAERIRRLRELGITAYDTAAMYGAGHGEEVLGGVFAGISNAEREELTVITKVQRENQGYDGVLEAAEGSLGRLGMDYVDLYLLHHFPDEGISIEGTMRAMDELVTQGLARAIGVCNVTPKRFNALQAALSKVSDRKLEYNQVEISLQERQADVYGIPRHAAANGYVLAPWRPFKLGELLSGEGSAMLGEIAQKYGCTPAQVALGWIMRRYRAQYGDQLKMSVVAKASPDHTAENVAALTMHFDQEDIDLLTYRFPGQRDKSDVPLTYPADVPAA
jgi:2,5-diketo-D-gluconate reductase A